MGTLPLNADIHFHQVFNACSPKCGGAGDWHCEEEFLASDEPPFLSEEARSYLETTTVHLSQDSPAVAGNRLLNFFRQQQYLSSRVNKVNQKKFTIRADVIVDGLACSIKVHVYTEDTGCLMEFQKRSGDSIAFSKAFDIVSAHLLRQPCSSGTVAWEPPSDAALSPAETLAPLLDLAEFQCCTQVLAEVASALVSLIADPLIIEELRRPYAASALQNLRENDHFSVAHPTASIIACM